MQTTQGFPGRRIKSDSYVRLIQEIPELGLHCGELGVTRGVLPGPGDAYEVEFHRAGRNVPVRALLLARQVEPEEGPLLTETDDRRFVAP